ncbi:MAG: phasin family protein [Magnetococcales bacterium]|nr:phasin family protein [Magnetococcales bacterium]
MVSRNSVSENYLINMTRTAVSSIIRLQEINDQTLQQLAKHQMEATSDFMDVGVKQLRTLGSLQNVDDMVTQQTDLAKELREKILRHTKQTVELLMSANSQLYEIMEHNLVATLNNLTKK